MSTFPDGEWLARSHITGPTYLKLAVAVSSTPTNSPSVEISEKLLHANSLTDEDVAASVLRGAAQANARYQTQLHPVAIKYASDGSSPLTRMEYVAFKMIEAAAIPRLIPDLQAAIKACGVSFNKLAQATGVSKSTLYDLSEARDTTRIEQDVLVRLLEYFRIVKDSG